MIAPRFQAQRGSNGQLSISNSHITYTVVPSTHIARNQLDRYLAYDRLNAYHKAMNDRQLPPIPQLAVDDILSQHSIFPKQLGMRLNTNDGFVVANTEFQWAHPTAEDLDQLRQNLAEATR
jgi:hypothetical protein